MAEILDKIKNLKPEEVDSLIGSVGSVGGAVGDIIGAYSANSQIADTSAQEREIDNLNSESFNYADYDSLQNAFDQNRLLSADYTAEGFMPSSGELALNTLKGMASGAMAGNKVGGPWGAVAGAGVGLAGGLAGMFVGKDKAEQRAADLNRESILANNKYLLSVQNNASNISKEMFNRAALNIAAFGGILKSPDVDNYTKSKIRLSAFGGNKLPKKMKYGGKFGNYFAYGGKMELSGDWSNGVTVVGTGGSHEKNPYQGVLMGIDTEGTPNLVEEGEVIYNDYVFSRRLKPTRKQLNEIFLPGKYEGKTYADIALDIQKESAENPNDPISLNSLEDGMMKLTTLQEDTRAKKVKTKAENPDKMFAEGGDMLLQEALRYAPVVGSANQVLRDSLGITNRLDYTNPNIIREAANRVRRISARPVGNYMTYSPVDVNYNLNRVSNMGLATQRGILNSAGQNRGAAMAGLMALNNGVTAQMGDAYRQGVEFNNNLRRNVTQFNAGINQMNAQLALQTDVYNQRADIERVGAAAREAALRDQIETTASTARAANQTGLYNNLGAVGKDMFNNQNAWNFIKAQGLEEQYKNFMNTNACGGRIKRKGLTY